MTFKFTYTEKYSTVPVLTKDEFRALVPDWDGAGQVRFDLARWPRVVGLAVWHPHEPNDHLIVYGLRRLQRARQSGYSLEGQVSVEGSTRRAFTTSQMFRVDGRLVDVAALFVCLPTNVEEGSK